MKTVKIKKDVRKDLDYFAEESESVDKAINRLLDLVEGDMDKDFEFGVGTTNINLDESTMRRIKSFQLNPRESYGRIIARALRVAKSKK